MIELGRYNQLPRDQRLCPIHKWNEIEDETHFLFHCEGYSPVLVSYKIELYFPDLNGFKHLLIAVISHCLSNSSDYYTNILNITIDQVHFILF